MKTKRDLTRPRIGHFQNRVHSFNEWQNFITRDDIIAYAEEGGDYAQLKEVDACMEVRYWRLLHSHHEKEHSVLQKSPILSRYV